MTLTIRTVLGLSALAATMLLQGCGKSDSPAASGPAGTAASAPAAAATAEIMVMKEVGGSPMTVIPSDVPKVESVVKTKGAKAGQPIRIVWIAVDVGDVAPKGTKIDEVTVTAERDDSGATSSLSQPTAGWPIGSYKIEVYIADKMAGSTNFKIE